MHRNQSVAQFGPQQSGAPMSPHRSPVGQMHPVAGSYQQGGSSNSGSYGHQSSQYGPPGERLFLRYQTTNLCFVPYIHASYVFHTKNPELFFLNGW